MLQLTNKGFEAKLGSLF